VLKRLAVALLVLLGLLAVADRYIASAAGSAAGGQVRRAIDTPANPHVTFGGFPFLTQALFGHFSRIDVVARDVPVQGLKLDRIDARFSGVDVKFGKALAGQLAAVPTHRAQATARLAYADLNTYLRRRGPITVEAAGGQLTLSGQVRVNGALISGRGRATVTVRPGSLVIRVVSASANGVPLPDAATRLFSVTVPTDALPFGISLQSVDVGSDALTLRGTATGIVIPTKKLVG
jgi:hypothetical protein